MDRSDVSTGEARAARRRAPFIAHVRGLLAATLLALVPSSAVAQGLDHTSEYRAILRFLCGEAGYTGCFERTSERSPNELADFGAELERLIALSEFEDELDDIDRFEREFERLCAEDPARCWVWIQRLARSGSVDADRDGVLDGQDACVGTSTPVARAQALLLAQQVAIQEAIDTLVRARLLLIQAANFTLGSAERVTMSGQFEPLFFDLLSVANKQVEGRFLFAGEADRKRPFSVLGDFEDGGPQVEYLGSGNPFALPAGRSGELIDVLVPGDRIFLAPLDLQPILYPFGLGGEPPENLFELLAALRFDLRDDGVEGAVRGLTWIDEAIAFVARFAWDNSETFATLDRHFPSTARSEVDASGCSQAQFCAAIPVKDRRSARICRASDFRNDEPLLRRPGDCRPRRSSENDWHCVESTGRRRERKR